MHSHTAEELRQLYPLWDPFQQMRQKIDPSGRFLNPYLRKLFGADPS
ncbi:MAG: FAD/FMN-containing dehydrogenase [Cellvibrionaceae bacterium]|jgi:FAD/FMN-containing dehydrogenase